MFGYFVQLRLVSFDEKHQLANVTTVQIVEQTLHILKTDKPIVKTVVHFVNPSCHCNSLTAPHIEQINQQAQKAGFTSATVNIDDSNPTIIPATPAILITDNNGDLMYFGPYSQGLACSQKNSMIDVVFKNYQLGFNSDLVISEAEGCYCQTG
ncbi:DUF6436 domain-containing protein [Alteromonadaceae bacterium BrNp21-10]|nr:DUF6436 domain-containing protein [Alteromonadaceae bacterium BrNp21-10]